jgi:hypothetical protein
MKPDHAKSQDELIEELNRLRQEAPKEKEVPKLPNERKRATDKNNTGKDQTAETLRVAQLIIDKSPAVLLQRTTGPNPRMVDVSDNICQFGYRPEEFLGGRLKFKDIIPVYDAFLPGPRSGRGERPVGSSGPRSGPPL